MVTSPEPVGDRSPLVSLDDRLAFRRAQAVLTGLTGCRRNDAARSLRSAADRLDRAVPDVARTFLDALEFHDDEQAVSLLLLLADGALRPEATRPRRGDSSDDEGDPVALGDVAAAARQVATADADVRGVPQDTAEGRKVIALAVRMQWLSPASGPRRVGAVPAVALDELYDRWAGPCLTIARYLLGDDERAECVVQATFLDAWQHLAAGEELPAPPERWFPQRTHQRAVIRLREERTRLPAEPATSATGRAPVGALPLDQRRAVQWAAWGGCTVQDIAVLTGTPLREVRASLLAGVRALGVALATGLEDPRTDPPG